MTRFLPFLDLRGYNRSAATADFFAAFTVIFMAVPQGVAYAMIADLPPAMGLYAAAIPAIIGSLMRSSRHVISGPSNALSLLVGSFLALQSDGDVVAIAITTAFFVGIFQIIAGLLRLGFVVDFISTSVVLGYISGAAVLIAIGQLPNLTASPGSRGSIWHSIAIWGQGLSQVFWPALLMGLLTAAFIVIFRHYKPKWPTAMLAMIITTILSIAFDLRTMGFQTVADIQPIPFGLPPVAFPDFSLFQQILPISIAATILSLVESSAVARAIAGRTNQHLDADAEFSGQGLANLTAAFAGGYPVSGSLSRSAINEQSGAQTRMSGVYSGVLMILVLLIFGPLVDYTPIAALAGLLMVVAWDLIDRQRIAAIFSTSWSDRLAFVATMLGTWTLTLDKAIYLGVAISLLMQLYKSRSVRISELGKTTDGALCEYPLASPQIHTFHPQLRIISLSGSLSFTAEGKLRQLLSTLRRDNNLQYLVLDLQHVQHVDYTIASAIAETATQLQEQQQRLLLMGCRPDCRLTLQNSGAEKRIGKDNIFDESNQKLTVIKHIMTKVIQQKTP